MLFCVVTLESDEINNLITTENLKIKQSHPIIGAGIICIYMDNNNSHHLFLMKNKY